MTTFNLTGTIYDSEGIEVHVSEFTSYADRNARSVTFYTSNGFTGELTLERTFFDGKTRRETIHCDRPNQ